MVKLLGLSEKLMPFFSVFRVDCRLKFKSTDFQLVLCCYNVTVYVN